MSSDDDLVLEEARLRARREAIERQMYAQMLELKWIRRVLDDITTERGDG